VRAVVEALAMELNRYLGFLSGAGISAGRLVMCGGAAGSSVTPQIVADATGLEVSCCAETETSALGAAVLARGLIRKDADLAELSRQMIGPMRQFAPGKDAATYRQIYREYVESLPRVDVGG
jgi:xylulokinase